MRVLHRVLSARTDAEGNRQCSASSWPRHLLEPQNAIILLPNVKSKYLVSNTLGFKAHTECPLGISVVPALRAMCFIRDM